MDSTSSSSANRGTVVLVDDDEAVRTSLRYALESEGYRIHAVCDRAEALEAVSHDQVDLVLLDLGLNGASGWDVLEQITVVHPFLPIIIITARCDQYRLASAAGVTALMEKPLSIPLLVRAIDQILSETQDQRVRRILTHRTLRLACSV